HRWNGTPRVRAGPTSTCVGSTGFPLVPQPALPAGTRASHSLACSLGCSLYLAGLAAHYGNEQVGDSGGAHLTPRRQLLTIDTLEQQDAAAEPLALMHRLECARGGDLLGIHHHLQIARLHLFHAAIEDDAATVDEHDVGEHVLDLF